MGSKPQINKPSKRLLTLSDLLVYGIILVQPIAPVGIYGLTAVISKGQVVTPLLFAMLAMACTAVSYGRLAALYPSSGSAYTYVRATFAAEAGFLVGWAMALTYIVLPVINAVYAALTLQRLMPSVPYTAWVVLFTITITTLNLRGILSISRISVVLMCSMSIVIAAFMILGSRYIVLTGAGITSLFSVRPLYDSSVFNVRIILSATALATLTFVGFDGVTTLTEETVEPRQTVPRATVWLCLITGLFSAAEVYIAQLAWPDYTRFHNQETAFMDVTQRVGGTLLFQAMGIVLIVACFGTGLTGLGAAARLLYGMGRDGILPKRVFGIHDRLRQQPTVNICVLGAASLIASLAFTYQTTAELLNFGAFVTFIGVNASAVRAALVGNAAKWSRAQMFREAIPPVFGFVTCSLICANLSWNSKILGLGWLAVAGLRILGKTRGFRRRFPVMRLEE